MVPFMSLGLWNKFHQAKKKMTSASKLHTNSDPTKAAAKQMLDLMGDMEKCMKKDNKINEGIHALCKSGWVGTFCDPRMKDLKTLRNTDQVIKWVQDEAIIVGKEEKAQQLAELSKLAAKARKEKEQRRADTGDVYMGVQDSAEDLQELQCPKSFAMYEEVMRDTGFHVDEEPSDRAIALGRQPKCNKERDYEQEIRDIEKEITLRAANQVHQYKNLSIPMEELKMSPLQWWKHSKGVKDLPLLKEVARKFLCKMVSSAPSERVFSASGNLITNKRNKLSPANVENMMLLKGMWGPCQEFLQTHSKNASLASL
ncbi:unnamed protein product [Chrysoparadoxa australica]